MKKILIISFSDLKDDPRVFRQIDYLRKDYHVTTVGWESPGLEDVEFYKISSISRSRLDRIKRAFAYKFHRFESLYWSLYNFQPLLDLFKQKRYDLIIANDVESAPFALEIANGAKILLDAHDYTPRNFEDQFIWRFFFQEFNKYLCRIYMKKCHRVITVSSGLAGEYKREYGISAEVITNAADYVDLAPSPVDEKNIHLIHHGVSNPNRQLESMIKIMDHADKRFRLDFMLVPTDYGYLKRLKKLAAQRGNVEVIPPVPREKIISFSNSYDLSFLVRRPTNVNFRYGLWNKFFESLQSRLGIVSGPTPEPQVEIINRYGCGLVTDSFEPKKIAEQLNRLTTKQIEEFKKKANIAAGELTSQKNMEKLGEIVGSLIKF